MTLLPTFASAAASAPTAVPGLAELSKAVAAVEDFRAIGIFLAFVILVMLALIVWLVIALQRSAQNASKPIIDTVIPVRIAMDAATAGLLSLGGKIDSLINAVANLTRAVDDNGNEAKEARRQLETLQARLDQLERTRE